MPFPIGPRGRGLNPRGGTPFTKGPFRRFWDTLSATYRLVRLSQQYAEVVQSGQTTQVRLSQQYAEVVINFGNPPPGNNGKGNGNGKGGDPPGHNKGGSQAAYQAFIDKLDRDQRLTRGRFQPDVQTLMSDQLPFGPEVIEWRTKRRNIRVGQNHIVRTN